VLGRRIVRVLEFLALESCSNTLHNCFVAVAVVNYDIALRGVEHFANVVLGFAGDGDELVQ
jgi:hypothetical protein